MKGLSSRWPFPMSIEKALLCQRLTVFTWLLNVGLFLLFASFLVTLPISQFITVCLLECLNTSFLQYDISDVIIAHARETRRNYQVLEASGKWSLACSRSLVTAVWWLRRCTPGGSCAQNTKWYKEGAKDLGLVPKTWLTVWLWVNNAFSCFCRTEVKITIIVVSLMRWCR